MSEHDREQCEGMEPHAHTHMELSKTLDRTAADLDAMQGRENAPSSVTSPKPHRDPTCEADVYADDCDCWGS